MATSMPIPQPPRTPTPPPDNNAHGPTTESHYHTPIAFDPKSLSPHIVDGMDSSRTSYFSPGTPDQKTGLEPFNFEPAALSKSPVAVKSVRLSVSSLKLRH